MRSTWLVTVCMCVHLYLDKQTPLETFVRGVTCRDTNQDVFKSALGERPSPSLTDDITIKMGKEKILRQGLLRRLKIEYDICLNVHRLVPSGSTFLKIVTFHIHSFGHQSTSRVRGQKRGHMLNLTKSGT